ncbi:hypothetical protein PTHTG4_01410 [Parageobacillus thermoglucosidasius]|nr:hypothetical protein PTHTG4_01410 [Parageobacillus thermoglucosidasius]
MAKKGQTFHTYSEELKREVVRLKLEEGWSYRQIREHFGIKSDAQIAQWGKKVQRGGSLKDQRGVWNRKHFSSLEEENVYWKAQVKSLKKRRQIYMGKIVLKSGKKGFTLWMSYGKIIYLLIALISEVSKAGYYKWHKSRSKRAFPLEEDLLLQEHFLLAIHKIGTSCMLFRVVPD